MKDLIPGGTALPEDKLPATVTRKEESRSLPFDMEDEDLRDMAIEAIHLRIKIKGMEEAEKIRHKAAKAKIEIIQSEYNEISDQVVDATEYRLVECSKEIDFEKNEVRIIRLDTNEVLSTDELTPQDKQLELDLEHNPNKDGIDQDIEGQEETQD